MPPVPQRPWVIPFSQFEVRGVWSHSFRCPHMKASHKLRLELQCENGYPIH